MTPMFRVVCVGPGPRERPRRVIDRGPLHHEERRAIAAADWLRATGLYESVTVERTGSIRLPGLGSD